MELPKLIILLSCIYHSYASHHHSHTIPVEGYDTELQNLGQHVEIPETPVKIIKITKTVAVKVPVPYPVKVIQKVPYPVHVSKPYPVPVTKIVHVPAPSPPYKQHSTNDNNDHSSLHANGGLENQSYQVQEGPSHQSTDSLYPAQDTFGGGNSGHIQNIESFAEEYPSEQGSYGGSSYEGSSPSQSYYGNTGNQEGSNSYESNNYDQAVQEYLNKLKPSGTGHNSGGW